ncbi:MAG TPA: hypothetical protein VIJ15_03050 [Dermatophilaceae bacterium]
MQWQSERWATLLGSDPREWLLACDEPAAHWVSLAGLLDRRPDDPDRVAAHAAVLADPGTRSLVDRLPDWQVDNRLSGHSSPGFAPNLLNLLADMGVGAGDEPRVERLLDSFLDHQDPSGRFASFGTSRASAEPVWGSLLCDTHAITEVLVRFGRADHPAVARALRQLAADLADTAQGLAWPCVPHSVTGFRGPGRKGDFCPQVTLEALRTLARLPEDQGPEQVLDAARTALRAWTARSQEKPYMFGHGAQFKTVKWPTFWYDVHSLLDTVSRYPRLWRLGEADPADRLAVAELVAALVAYNFDADGTVTPRSCYQGFAEHSFGQKKRPSGFATARLAVLIRRFDDLADDARAVDVERLASSKGGTGQPVPPRGHRR